MTIILLTILATLLVAWFSAKAHRTRNLLLLGLAVLTVFSLAGCGVNFVQTAEELQAVIAGIIPLAGAAASALVPAEAQKITSAASVASNAVQELGTVIKSYNSSPNDTTLQKVQAAFTDVNANLAGLESAAQVKDPATAKKITAIVSAATATVAVLEASLLAKHPAAVQAAGQPMQG